MKIPLKIFGFTIIIFCVGAFIFFATQSNNNELLASRNLVDAQKFELNGIDVTPILKYPEQAASYIVWKEGVNYYSKDTDNGEITNSSDASLLINSILNKMGNDGGKLFIKTGDYEISSTIVLHGGVYICGEGLNKYNNQKGTRLRLISDTPMFKVDGGTLNQYFISISDMELYGDGRSTKEGVIGIYLKSGFSDYIIERCFIHGFYTGIYASNSGWFGKIISNWIEGNQIGLDLRHKQIIIMNNNISSCSHGVDLKEAASGIILSGNEIILNTWCSFYLEYKTSKNFNIIIDASQIVDNLNGMYVYAYNGAIINLSFTNCEFGNENLNTEKYVFQLWVDNSSKISLQCTASKFFSVINNYINFLSENQNNIKLHFNNNIGYIDENSGNNIIKSGTNSVIINHGCSFTPSAKDVSILITQRSVNDPGYIYVDNFTNTQFEIRTCLDVFPFFLQDPPPAAKPK